MRNTDAENIVVTGDGPGAPRGTARLGGRAFRCALGRSGIADHKREGDGATPGGSFALRRLLYRADRFRPPPEMPLSASPLDPRDGWCDEPGAATYNCQVRLPHPYRHETLWREDGVYDAIVVVGHNDSPPIAGRGSAIFLHLARDGLLPTEGCVAFARPDLLAILALLVPRSRLVVVPPKR